MTCTSKSLLSTLEEECSFLFTLNTNASCMDLNGKHNSFIINDSLNLNSHICRYMDFDVFLALLCGNFYVPRRQNFMDIRESGTLSVYQRFAFVTYPPDAKKISEALQTNQKRIEKFIQNYQVSRLLLTSCWSEDIGENYLMWKSYTSRVGICVRTTIGDFLNSIENISDDYLVICSPISYRQISSLDSTVESIFSKELYYSSENEIRFYFIPRKYCKIDMNMNNPKTGNQINEIIMNFVKEEEMHSKDANYKNYQIFHVNPQRLIKSVILSPFLKPNTTSNIKKILVEKFNDIFANEKMITDSKLGIRS